MANKKIVQDIVPTGKRSIRNIPISTGVPVRRTRKAREIEDNPVEEAPEEVVEEIEEKISRTYERKTYENIQPRKKGGSGKYLLSFIVVFIGVAIIGFALSLSYSKAIVTITPKVTNFNVNGTFTAKKNAPGADFGYEVITMANEAKKTIPATKGPAISTKAKGTAIIYNNYSANPQTLVAGTRLTDPDGLVFRTSTTVTVPGKKTQPGSVQVSIVADQPGAEYNISIAALKGDLKLPGYKGTDKYTGFYGRLKSDLSGGFAGNKMSVSPTAKATAVTELEASLKQQLIAQLESTVPGGYVLYDSAVLVDFEIPEPTMVGDDSAEVKVRGVANAAIFKSDSLIKFIAGNEIKKFPSDTYVIKGDKELEFKISNTKDFMIKKGTPMIFTLKGPISITGTFSEAKLKDELKGIKLQDSNAVFAKYKSISNAYALITPFWLRSFPSSVEKIIIEYK